MPCFSYTVHLTPYTESKNIFFIFDLYPFIARSVFIWIYLPSHARLRARTTRIIRYAHASNANGHNASPTGFL